MAAKETRKTFILGDIVCLKTRDDLQMTVNGFTDAGYIECIWWDYSMNIKAYSFAPQTLILARDR